MGCGAPPVMIAYEALKMKIAGTLRYKYNTIIDFHEGRFETTFARSSKHLCRCQTWVAMSSHAWLSGVFAALADPIAYSIGQESSPNVCGPS
eukprot:8090145-Pyramimonas_sp.AAC.1